MKIHRQLMVLVGFGILSIMAVTILSLQYISATFSRTSVTIAQISAEAQQIWVLERQLDKISQALDNYVLTGDRTYVQVYDKARAEADAAVGHAEGDGTALAQNVALDGVIADLERVKKKGSSILALQSPQRDQRMMASNLLTELKGLREWIDRDLERYRMSNAAEMDRAIMQVRRNTMRINLVFLGILLTSVSFLFTFALYFRRKISAPLLALWEGTEEISRGNLDYRLQVQGNSDIARLAERFNAMSQQLRASYADLEQKLYERTHELASLDAVALTLSQAGSLKDLLDRALLRVLDSLSGINAKGGIFLCEPGESRCGSPRTGACLPSSCSGNRSSKWANVSAASLPRAENSYSRSPAAAIRVTPGRQARTATPISSFPSNPAVSCWASYFSTRRRNSS